MVSGAYYTRNIERNFDYFWCFVSFIWLVFWLSGNYEIILFFLVKSGFVKFVAILAAEICFAFLRLVLIAVASRCIPAALFFQLIHFSE